ncbi:hypothetical protein [Methanosarcina siciliae]|uniref:hypothetical protein n=1 Tax=Methanosarcina siciliae TaxID=38027 RepID=UPI000A5E602D|nr:hypothetical protein [Methanosarcina siciliae]
MPFNMLVTSCYVQGTSFKDKDPNSPKVSIQLKDSNSEKILFFVIDDENNPKSKFREFFNMKGSGEKICDLLVYYSNDSNGQDSLIVAETKGTDFERAANQIINTYQKLISNTGFCSNGYCKKLNLKVCCISNRGRIVGIDDKKKKAKDKVIKTTKLNKKDCDFIEPTRFYSFITGTSTSNKQKKKK